MIMRERNHFEVVKESLNGRREVDEGTFASIEVLRERVERLKKLGDCFSGVGFSPFLHRLAGRRKEVAVS